MCRLGDSLRSKRFRGPKLTSSAPERKAPKKTREVDLEQF